MSPLDGAVKNTEISLYLLNEALFEKNSFPKPVQNSVIMTCAQYFTVTSEIECLSKPIPGWFV